MLILLPLTAAGCFGGGGSKAGGEAAATHVSVIQMENSTGEAAILAPYVEAVARLSGGALRIQTGRNAHSGDPDFEEKVIEDVQAGRAELGWVGARAWHTVGVPSFDALVAPFLIGSYPLQQRVLESGISTRMLAGVHPLGLVGIGIVPGPMRRLLGVRKKFLQPSDYTGAVIGLQRSDIAQRTFRVLKAIPVAQPVRADLSRLDGYEQQIGAVFGNQYFAAAKAVTTNAVFWPRPLVLFTSQAFFSSLSSLQQQVLLRAAHDSIPAFSAQAAAEDRSAAASLCRVRFPLVSSTPGQLDHLRAAVKPVYRWLERDAETRSYIRRIEAMRSESPVTAPFSCERPATVSGAPSTVDGVYRMSLTAKEVARHDKLPVSQAIPENYGDFVLVVDSGRFAFTQQNRLACTWGYGRVSIAGERMKWEFIDGGGVAPTNAENKPGELFVWRWNLYREVLSLRPMAPTDLSAEMWRRVTSKPSTEYLNPDCRPPADALP